MRKISKLTSLIHTIQQAFSGVTLGNGIGLSEGNAMDDYAPAEECARCRKQDEQTHWHKIPVELLNQILCSPLLFRPRRNAISPARFPYCRPTRTVPF